jgi:N-acetylglucosaminyldiphosphoundecaprenol N-acetyl-beta-D-mannosaminyltransferase
VAEPGIPRVVEVLGIRFQALTRLEAAEAIAALAKSHGKSYVVKPYSEFLPRAARDAQVRSILEGADLCLADGAGILWAAHYLSLPGGAARALAQFPLSLAGLLLNPSAIRRPLPEAMAGVDLTLEMLGALDRSGLTVFLLGGSRTEIDGARRAIERRFPELRIVGAHPGHFSLRGTENDEVVSQVNDAAPDVLLVAMGFPRQEIWIAENLERLNVHVAVAEGGSFTFIAGAVPRAPGWMRRSGLEWLFRLARQPWRLRRQLALPVFVWLVLRERLSRKV